MDRWFKLRLAPMLASLLLAALAPTFLYASSATLLLEEPYGKLGFFSPAGHVAVYLSGVCAETPLKLRACKPHETGVVISRYNGLDGHDWMAVPLLPYLYAVDRPEDVPLFADAKMVSFLRDQYRRKHLETVAPDAAGGEMPGGNWVQLVGSAYDRTSYAFEVETTPERDAEFIRDYNASANVSHFHIMTRNCADFAKDVINYYYPRALRRSVVADVGMSTPKQMANRLVKYSVGHEDLDFRRYVIPQVAGTLGRSTAARGVVESFFRSKKYIVPSALLSPIFAGSVAAVYVETQATGRFDPARKAQVYSPVRQLEEPIGAEDRRSRELELKHLTESTETSAAEKDFLRAMESGAPGFDPQGRLVVRVGEGLEAVSVGVTAANILGGEEKFSGQIMELRLREELKRGGPPKASYSDVEKDWALLERALHGMNGDQGAKTARLQESGNQP